MLFWPFLIRSGVSWRAAERRPAPPAWLEAIKDRGLLPTLSPGPAVLRSGPVDGSGRRILHVAGDPDGAFTFGSSTRSSRLKAVVEVTDVLPRAIAPEPDTGDDRPRAAGDYQPIDAAGHPRQLRVAARITW